MAIADFVHLRVRSAYSLSEGAIKLPDLVDKVTAMDMPAVAVTDTGNLFGAMEFSSLAAKAGVQPILGALLGITPAEAGERRYGHLTVHRGGAEPPDRLLLLVQSETGYRHLVHLLSRAFLDSEAGTEPQIPLDMLTGATDGLLAFTGGPSGPLGRPLLSGHPEEADTVLQRLMALFPGRLYMEIMRHGLPDEERTEESFLEMAYRHGIPLIATNDVFFADTDMYQAHDALLCIAEGTVLTNPQRRHLTPEHRLKTPQEMRSLFTDLPEAVDNSLVVARRCAHYLSFIKPILPPYATGEGRDEGEELRVQARAGLERRMEAHVYTPDMDEETRNARHTRYHERLERELGIIDSMGFPGYFLIVADFIQWAKDRGIPVGPGRGSGAGSVVAWALLITDLDPIRWGLLFERFLNPERVSMPDFDVDFCQDRRDEVIRYVRDKYGADKVAQIITFGKLQARAVLRDVGRVLGMPYGQVDRLCKLVPNNPAKPTPLAEAVETEQELKRQRDTDEQVADLINRALKLEGLYRHASTHAAGVVIGDRPLEKLVPLYRDPRSDMPVTQFNMKYVEQAGLVKFDFLGLKTLSVLQMAVSFIREAGASPGDRALDLASLPLDDRATYQLLGRGDTVGVFQLESSGMRDVLRQLRPDRFEDIIAVVALYRPGPMDNIPSYIKRKHGEETPDYLHPKLEPFLKETYGIMIYQEQVMRVAQVLSGYSLGGADLLRRAMGKKIQAEMDKQRVVFIDGAKERGVGGDKAALIFDQVAKFAGYGFNKSHAAAYALVAYHTAYLKAHHPEAFLAASMSYDLANTDKLAVFRAELQRQRIPLLPPDVNRSRSLFTVERQPSGPTAVRYALAAVKNVGEQAMETMVAARDEGGPFPSLVDFSRRVDPRALNRRLLENLVATGAFDSLEPNRRRVHEAVEPLLRLTASMAQERDSLQTSLFGEETEKDEARLPLGNDPDWPIMERLSRENEALGFYLSAHPLDAYGTGLERLNVLSSADLASTLRAAGGAKRLKLAGIVVSKREGTAKRTGNRYAILTMSDKASTFEVMLFSEALAVSRPALDSDQPLLVTADGRLNDDEVRLSATTLVPLDDAVAHASHGLKIRLSSQETVTALQTLLTGDAERAGGKRGPVTLVLELERQEIEIALPGRWPVSAAVRKAARALPGIGDVRDV